MKSRRIWHPRKLIYGIILMIALISIPSNHVQGQTSAYAEEGFEEKTTVTTLTGSSMDVYGIWRDGGSGVSQKNSRSLSGEYSMVIEDTPMSPGGRVDENGVYIDPNGYEKPYYASIYTESLDFSETDSATLVFNWFISASSDSHTVGTFRVQVSNDNGETFHNLFSHDKQIPGGWVEERVSIPARYLSATTILRIKGFYNIDKTYEEHADGSWWDDQTKVYLDDMHISYSGGAPTLSSLTIQPTNDTPATNSELYSFATFDSDTEQDWGYVWVDGGRNAYTSAFLAESGTGNMVLRYRYLGEDAHNGTDPDTGEDLGYQKPTYSAIHTQNLDLTRVQDLQIAFSFVPYGVGYSDQIPAEDEVTTTYFVLSLSTNAGIDFTPVETWRAGEDYIELQRYDVLKTIPGDLIGPEGFTTTTIIKIQAFGRSESDQIYIDNLRLYTVGSRPSPVGAPIPYDSDSATVVMLEADSTKDTYELINSTWVEDYDPTTVEGAEGYVESADTYTKFYCIYGAVEHTDKTHDAHGASTIDGVFHDAWDGGKHIRQVYDSILGKEVFAFYIHQHDHSPFLNDIDRAYSTPGTDRCRDDDEWRTNDGDPNTPPYNERQRVEIKTYSESPDTLLAIKEEVHLMAWKMFLPLDFQVSDKFTHLHQLKPVGGEGSSMPLITLTAVAAKPATDDDPGETAKLNLRYSPSAASQITIAQAELDDLRGKWVHIIEKVKFNLGPASHHVAESGVNSDSDVHYEIVILDAENLAGEPLMEFVSYSLPTWKIDNLGEFIRAKWGIYRNISQGNMLKDEEVRFADILIAELSNEDAKLTDLRLFAYEANQISSSGNGETAAPTEHSILGTEDADEVYITQGNSSLVSVSVNGVVTELTPTEAAYIQINTSGGNDTVIVDPDVVYGELVVYGGTGADLIIGGNENDQLYGENGNDTIIGRGGEDFINGGGGSDKIGGSYGIDTIVNTAGTRDRLVSNGDILEDGSYVYIESDNFSVFSRTTSEIYVNTLLEHLELLLQGNDSIELTNNTSYSDSQTFFTFSGIEDLDHTVVGDENYEFQMLVSQQESIEEAILDLLETRSSEAQNEVNSFLNGDHVSEYAPYVLWRLGGVSIARAQFVYDNYIDHNGDKLQVRIVSDADAWESHTILFGFPGDETNWHPADESLFTTTACTSLGGDCSGTITGDLQHFRELLQTTPGNETYLDVVLRVQSLFGGEVASQAVAAQRAAQIMLDNWGDYHSGSTVTVDDIVMALGYTENTNSVPMVPNTQTDLRGALAYALHDDAFFNALDLGGGHGETPDGLISEDDLQSFLGKTDSDAQAALSWYAAQDTDKYSEIRNQVMMILIANRELLDTAASGEASGEYGYNSRLEDDGDIEHEDFAYYANSNSDLLILMRQVSSFVLSNPAIYFQLDTGGSIFHPTNPPDGLITVDDITSIAGYIDLSPDGLTSYIQQSLLIRGIRGNALLDSDLNPSTSVRATLYDILMAWDGYYWLATNPDGIIESDKIDELESMLDRIMAGTLADEDASTWIGDNLNSEFQHWFAESPDIYLAFQSYIETDYTYSDAYLNEIVMEIYDEAGEDYESAMIALGYRFQPLSLFPNLSGLYADNYRKSVELLAIIDMAYSCEVNDGANPSITCDGYTYEGEELDRLIWETYSYLMGGTDQYLENPTLEEFDLMESEILFVIDMIVTAVKLDMAYMMFDFNVAIVAGNLSINHTYLQGLVLKGYVAVAGSVLGVASMVHYMVEYHDDPMAAWIIISYVSHLISSGFEYGVMMSIGTSIDLVDGPMDRIRQMNPHSSGNTAIVDNIDSSGDEVPLPRRGMYDRQATQGVSNYDLTIERLDSNAELRKLSYDHKTLNLLSRLDYFSAVGSVGFAYLAYQSLEQAIEDGNTVAIVFASIDFGLEVASGTVTLIQFAVAMLKVPGAAVLGAINSGLAIIGGLVTIAYTIYQMVQQYEYIQERIGIRRDAEQVFTYRIVEMYNSNHDNDTIITWNQSENEDWWERGFQGGDGAFGDCEMDDYFTVGLEGDTCDWHSS